jgi:hypothetical protein
MTEIIIQYTLIVILVLGIGYLVYFLKEKGVIRNDDYFGITYTILGMLTAKDATPQNVKNILRVVSSAVQFVEVNLKGEENSKKENKALELAKDSLKLLKLNSEISDDSIRFIIRISCALLPSTHNKNQA